MPPPSYSSVPLPSFSAMQHGGLANQSVEFERVLSLLHDVDDRVADLYPQLTDHWLQSELYAFLHVKDELVSRVKKRATRKFSMAAGAADRRKELRVSTSTVTAAGTEATGAAASSLTSPDSGATEILKGAVPATPANESMAATPARHSKSAVRGKSIVGNKQRMSAALREMVGEQADDKAASESNPATSVTGEKDEEAKESEVISPLPHVNHRAVGTGGGRVRNAAVSSVRRQKLESKRLFASHSSSAMSSIPVFTAFAGNRKRAPVPAFARKNTRPAIQPPPPGQTARVLQEEHAELAMKLDELQNRQKQLADKQDRYIAKREREDEERRKKEEEAAAAAQTATAEAAVQSTTESAVSGEAEVESVEMLRAPPSPGRLAPLPLDGSLSPRSPRHPSASPMPNALSPMSSARPLRPHSPSLPPLPAATAILMPLTARVMAAPLSARDLIVQPTTHFNDEAQRGTICSGLMLCAPTPRLLLRPSTQEMEERQALRLAQQAEQAVEPLQVTEMDQTADEQQPAVSEVEQETETVVVSQAGLEQDASPQQVGDQQTHEMPRPASRPVEKLMVDVPIESAPLPPISPNSAASSLSPLAGPGTSRTLRPSTAEISNSATVATSPPTPSARSRMAHRSGQSLGLAVVPTSPVGLPPSSARSRATSCETPKAVYEESFPTIGSRRSSIQRDEAAVVAESVKGLGNLVENNRVEAVVEAAEARIKKERWVALMRDIEKRKRRGGDMNDAEDELARERRKWRDESLITASDLRKQIALMGMRMDEADERTGQAGSNEQETAMQPLAAIDPLDVPLPPSARTARSSRPTTSTSVDVEATQQLQNSSSTPLQSQTAEFAKEQTVSALPAIDPTLVPLPLSSRTATQTARTDSGSANDEPTQAEGASGGVQLQWLDSGAETDVIKTLATEAKRVDEQASPIERAVEPHRERDEPSQAVQEDTTVDGEILPPGDGSSASQPMVGAEGGVTENSSV